MARMRAVSPVVATALLVLIAVATAVLLYLWVSGTVAAQPTQQKSLQEEIKIDAVKIEPVTGGYNITAYVRNSGQVTVTVNGIYVINATSGSVLTANTTQLVSLAPGKVGILWAKYSGTLPSGTTLVVKVTTKEGVEAQYVVVYNG